MLIDWGTVAAQIVNFIILVALLKYFLYERILTAMDTRKQDIAGQISAARQAREDAESALLRAKEELNDLEAKRAEMFVDAQAEVEVNRKAMLRDAKAEIQHFTHQWHENLLQEKEEFRRTFRNRIGKELMEIARHALADLTNIEIERQAVQVFLKKLQNLDNADREAFTFAIKNAGAMVRVRSAFALTALDRDKIDAELKNTFGHDFSVIFEVTPKLVLGIEAFSGGRKIDWSLAGYMDLLEKKVLDTLAVANVEPAG